MYRSVQKLVPACSSGQLRSRRRHQSYSSSYRQSKIDSHLKRKDSYYNAAAPEPGEVPYVLYANDPVYDASTHALMDNNSAKVKVTQEYAVSLNCLNTTLRLRTLCFSF